MTSVSGRPIVQRYVQQRSQPDDKEHTMKHSAKKKAGKRATKKGLGAKPVTTAQKTPVGSTPAKAARTAGLKAPVDWVAAGRKAWETRQRNLAAGGAPVKKAKVATVATVPDAPIDAPITLDEIGESATL